MKLWTLLKRQAGDAWLGLLWTTLGSGVLAASVVTIANLATAVDTDLGSPWRAGLFLLLVVGMYFGRKNASKRLIVVFEGASAQLRQEFAARVREAPLRSTEALDDRLNRTVADLAFISNTLEAWVTGVQQLTFLLCMTLSVSLISMRALLLWALTLGLIGLLLQSRRARIRGDLVELSVRSGELGHKVEQLVEGFSQAKLDGRIAASLADDIEDVTRTLYDRQNAIEERKVEMFIGSIVVMFVVGSGTAAFVGIGLSSTEAYEMVLFFELAYTALIGVVSSLPEMGRSEAAAKSILATIELLPARTAHSPSAEALCFETLELCEATFTYTHTAQGDDFVVGPLDLSIRRGDLVMITGGNGSGKTTLIKMLIGLYPLDEGCLVVDGERARPRMLAGWHEQFTTIMSHQYLFERLYGLEDATPERVRELLVRFGLERVTDYRNQRFTNLNLSTGQQMRLAMVVALLEERPVCVFDEWTANQDPQTTHWYYDTLLPELQAAGRTLIVVSHDDRFFDRADLLIRMDGGQLVAATRRPR